MRFCVRLQLARTARVLRRRQYRIDQSYAQMVRRRTPVIIPVSRQLEIAIASLNRQEASGQKAGQ